MSENLLDKMDEVMKEVIEEFVEHRKECQKWKDGILCSNCSSLGKFKWKVLEKLKRRERG